MRKHKGIDLCAPVYIQDLMSDYQQTLSENKILKPIDSIMLLNQMMKINTQNIINRQNQKENGTNIYIKTIDSKNLLYSRFYLHDIILPQIFLNKIHGCSEQLFLLY